MRWTKLRKITGQAFSEVGRRNFGRPTCIAVAAVIVLGTSKGIILVFDYNQNLKSIIGPGTKAVESGSITSISVSADYSTIGGGHASGSIFTWDVSRPAKPFLHIPPVDRVRTPNVDGHAPEAAILHIGFLGTRHTALVSADDKGMAFSHLATRGMGVVARAVKTTRILGRYPDSVIATTRQRKPSSVLAFSPLPLGNAEHTADTMGLVAMLTPYLLVIVSTTPVAQTQYKTPRPKDLAAHGTMSAALAWFPSIKLRPKDAMTANVSSRAKLVYCWSNVLTILEVVEVEPSESSAKEEPPSLQFRPRSRWKAEEVIVGIQWLSRSVLAVLTITQQLIILEDTSLQVTDSSDLIQKHVYHTDLFSQQLNRLVDQLDEEDASMHGVVADAFHMSFRAYKGRLFLLGYNEVSIGTLSNWADRLLALMEEGDFIGAIQLATSYYKGEGDKVTVALPEDDASRHKLVQEKLIEMMSASLKYAFGKNKEAKKGRAEQVLLEELATACIAACLCMSDMDFLFEDAYEWYQDSSAEGIFLETLESYIVDGEIEAMPPSVIKDLVSHYTSKGLEKRLESMICELDPLMMDIDQMTSLCKRNNLYDALLYVWNQALNDYISLITDLLDLAEHPKSIEVDSRASSKGSQLASASKIFPYLSYILTSRIYPTGKDMSEERAVLAKADVYHFFFSGRGDGRPNTGNFTARHGADDSFPNLRKILNFDAPSFLSMLNEAFEDNFLNGAHAQVTNDPAHRLTEAQTFGLSVNRQWVVSILLELMTPPTYGPADTIYLDMFIARNLPKFPQFILLPGHILHRVLIGLCKFPEEDMADDCQLSAEYLLSMYQPPDLPSLIPLLREARFYRVLKSIYKTDKQYAELLLTCFEDLDNQGAVFDCIADCLRPSTGLDEKQVRDVRAVIINHAYELIAADSTRAASTIEEYAADLHEVMLQALVGDEAEQFQYLRNVLEPQKQSPEGSSRTYRHASSPGFVEQYVRLLCNYDRNHVSDYVEQLKTGDLRLEEVLPALEGSGVIDAAVVLMAREGNITEAIRRLVEHLDTLEAALLGLLGGLSDSPDPDSTVETANDLVASVQKYARVGVWLCRGQTISAQQSRAHVQNTKRGKIGADALSPDENLWLDLIDAVVRVTKNVSEILESKTQDIEVDGEETIEQNRNSVPLDHRKLVIDLRTVVQEMFTALLATTSTPRATDSHRTDVSFIRIFRSFLSRASLSSPSLSHLRAVLGAIFSAYSYEESLLSLANRLLDKDLFVHVTEVDQLRRRGWRPLGQLCEGCGKRVWGPGAGVHIWDAWQQRNENDATMTHRRNVGTAAQDGRQGFADNGKGKAAMNDGSNKENPTAAWEILPELIPPSKDGQEMGNSNTASDPGVGTMKEGLGALVIFSCRHLFHRACLQKIHSTTEGELGAEAGNGKLLCPLCPG